MGALAAAAQTCRAGAPKEGGRTVLPFGQRDLGCPENDLRPESSDNAWPMGSELKATVAPTSTLCTSQGRSLEMGNEKRGMGHSKSPTFAPSREGVRKYFR